MIAPLSDLALSQAYKESNHENGTIASLHVQGA